MSNIFPVIETFAPLIPLAAYLKHRPAKAKWLSVLLIFFVVDICLVAYANFTVGSLTYNIPAYVLITDISFLCFALVNGFFIKNKKFNRINCVVIILVILFSIVNFLWLEGSKYYNSNSSSLASLVLIIYSIIYYKQQLINPESIFIEKQPSFWVVSGIFIYAAGNFFLFTFYHLLSVEHGKDEGFAEYIWIVVDCLILIMNIFFAKGIKCHPKK